MMMVVELRSLGLLSLRYRRRHHQAGVVEAALGCHPRAIALPQVRGGRMAGVDRLATTRWAAAHL
jgi:hypothetical protein